MVFCLLLQSWFYFSFCAIVLCIQKISIYLHALLVSCLCKSAEVQTSGWSGICMVECVWENCLHVSICNWEEDSRTCLTMERWRTNLVLQFLRVYSGNNEVTELCSDFHGWLASGREITLFHLQNHLLDVCINRGKRNALSVGLGIVSYRR